MYKLILKDGTVIDNLTKTGGGNWLSEIPVDKEGLTDENLSIVKVIEGESEIVMRDMTCDFLDEYEGGYSFNTRSLSPQEVMVRDMRSENAMLEEAIIELAELIGG